MSAAAVRTHLAAFNAHDTEALLAGLDPDAVWATGAAVVRGRDALRELFDAGLWAMAPSLAVRTLIGDGPAVAAELVEDITVDGRRHRFPIAAFFAVAGDGTSTGVKVYREGGADVPATGAAAAARPVRPRRGRRRSGRG